MKYLLLLLLFFFSFVQGNSFKIGVLPYTNSIEIIKLYEPLNSFLQKELNQPIEIYTSKDYKTFYDDSKNNLFDIIITGPHLGTLHLNQNFKSLYRYNTILKPIFVVSKDSIYNSISDLKNTKIALSGKLSVSSMAGIKVLKNLGFQNDKDYKIIEAKSHTTAIKAVLLKEVDAAITTYTPLKQLLDNDIKEKIRIIESDFEMPHLFILANPNISDSEAKNLKDILKKFEQTEEGKIFFAKTGYKGFIDISKKDKEDMDSLIDDTKKFLENTYE